MMQEVYFMYSQSGEFGVSKFNSVLPGLNRMDTRRHLTGVRVDREKLFIVMPNQREVSGRCLRVSFRRA
jgi:hypothetical protein